jgi:Superinfection immunity protein
MISKLITVIVLGGLVTASVAMYLLPVLIGLARHVPGIGVIAVINILLGWTLAGWVVALALALRPAMPGGAMVQFVQNLPPSPPPAGQLPGAGWAGPPGPPPSRLDPPPPLVFPQHPPEPGAAGQRDASAGAGSEDGPPGVR